MNNIFSRIVLLGSVLLAACAGHPGNSASGTAATAETKPAQPAAPPRDAAAAAIDQTLSGADFAALATALDRRGVLDCARFVPLYNGTVKYGAFSTTASMPAARG